MWLRKGVCGILLILIVLLVARTGYSNYRYRVRQLYDEQQHREEQQQRARFEEEAKLSAERHSLRPWLGCTRPHRAVELTFREWAE
jgi:hypothetical protein